MKRCIILLVATAILLTGCSSESDFYGVWYYEANGMRDVIQFSESSDGKDAFVWAVYDVEKDETVSISNGYFNSDGSNMVLTYLDDGNELILEYSLDGDKLTLSSESATIVLTKFVLE